MRAFLLIAAATLTAALGFAQPGAGSPAHVTAEPFASDGTPVDADLPKVLHMKNTGGSDGPRGPGSGSGLCVFTSTEHSARYQNVTQLLGFQKWMTRKPGGGYPEKLDDMIAAYCREQKVPVPAYVQIQSNDLSLLKAAAKSARMIGVTYAVSPTGRYGGARIAHMVNLVAVGAGKGPDGKGWYCVLDNNFPGSYEWMSEAQFLRSYSGGSRGWAVIFCNPCPPPSPLH